MADAKLVATLDLDTGKFEGELQKAEKTAEKSGSKIGKKFAAGVKAGAAALGALGLAAGKSAGDFEFAIAKVRTLAGKNTKRLREQILALDPALGAAGQAAEAAYQAMSANVDPMKAIGFVKQAAIAAKGGFTDMTTSVDAATSVINAYGLQGDEALAVFDKFLATQNRGKTTFGEIGRSIGDVASTAAAFGTDLTTVLGITANLTKGGIATSKAMTGLRQVFVNLQKPSKDAAATLQALGFTIEKMALNKKTDKVEPKDFFDEAAFKKFLGEEGIVGLFEKIKTESPDATQAVANIFGSVEASGAVNRLLGNLDAVRDDIDAVADSAGSAKDAADIMGDTFNAKLGAVTNSLEKVLIAMGDKFLPEIKKITDGVLENMDSLTEAAEFLGKVIKTITDGVKFISQGLGTASVAAEQIASGNLKGGAAALGIESKEGQAGFVKGLESGSRSFITSLPGGALFGKALGLPGFAAGTPSAPPGMAVVGEKGPELVKFRGGEQVVPNNELSGFQPSGILGLPSTESASAHVEALLNIRRMHDERVEKGIQSNVKAGEKGGKERVKAARSTMAGLTKIASLGGSRMFKVSKSLNLASALMNAHAAFTEVLRTPGLPPGVRFGMAASALVSGLNQVASIKTQKPPAFARGTDFAPGGLALVGEEGPELVNLPRGSGVSTASETREAIGARIDFRGAVFQFGTSAPETISDVDARELALRIEDVIRRGEAPGLEGAIS